MVRSDVQSPRLRGEDGFSLIEMLTVMAIMSFVLTGIISLYMSGIQAQRTMSSRFDAQTSLQVGLDKIRKDVHLACSESSSSATSVTLLLAPCDATAGHTTWCTRASGTQYALYQVTSSTTCAVSMDRC